MFLKRDAIIGSKSLVFGTLDASAIVLEAYFSCALIQMGSAETMRLGSFDFSITGHDADVSAETLATAIKQKTRQMLLLFVNTHTVEEEEKKLVR